VLTYLFAGICVIVAAALLALWLRVSADRAEKKQGRRDLEVESLLQGPLPFELDTLPSEFAEDGLTTPGYLTPQESMLPKRAARSR
jgi:hypothetical protein